MSKILRGTEIPLPPPPVIEIGLFGASESTASALAERTSVVFRSVGVEPGTARVAALVVDERHPRSLDAIRNWRAADPALPIFVYGERRDTSRAALCAGASFVLGAPEEEDLMPVARSARQHAMTAPAYCRQWASEGLAAWISELLATCDLTPRNCEVVAHSALGSKTRDAVAGEMEISVKRVDEHVGRILSETGQQSLSDLARPFAGRIAALRSSAGSA